MTITLYWNYLLYDVEQLTHRYSKARIADMETQDVAAFTKEDKSDKDLMHRFVITGTAHLRSILREFLDKKSEESNDVLPQYKTSWGFSFLETAPTFDGHAMAELMHWFIIRFCLWHWLKMFAPTEAEIEGIEMEKIEYELKSMLDSDEMPTKQRLEYYEDSQDIVYVPPGYPNPYAPLPGPIAGPKPLPVPGKKLKPTNPSEEDEEDADTTTTTT